MSKIEQKPRPAVGPVRLTRGQKWIVFGASIGVWLSGALWLIYKYFLRVTTEFGQQQNPLEPLWQKFHGGFAFAATFAAGLLWSIHVVRGWNVRWRRWSGGTIFGLSMFLIISGGALYYISNDDWRGWTAIAHWVVGLAALLFFLIHWLSRSRAKVRDLGK